MSTRIRLARFGKKGKPFYHIVVADQRSPRDGRFIEKIGTYNPNTNPATIDLDNDSALEWLSKGAQPTDTVRAILSYRGILYRNHLNKGVTKGALTQDQADAKFEAWLKEKEAKVSAATDAIAKKKADAEAALLAAEREVNAAREKELLAKQAEEAAVEAPAEEAAAEEAPAEEAPAEEAKEEAPAEEAKEEAPAEEAKEEAPAEEAKEEAPAEEAKEEAPAEEAKEEAPAEEAEAEDKEKAE